jgi:hypothetical protein
MLWEIIDPSYLKTRIDNLDLSISGLRDALRGTGNKTLTDLDTDLSNIYGRLDVALSTRASESTLSGIKTGTDYIDDIYGRIDVLLSTRASESTLSSILGKLDVALSTRASETTLSNIYNRLDVTLSTRLADSKIPNVLGQVSTDVVGSTMYALAVLERTTPSRMPYLIDDIAVGTTESSTSIAAPGAKIVKITNKSDTDVLIGVNGSVPISNPLKVRARTAKIFVHHSVTSISYKVSAGSATISIEYWN